MGRLVLQRWPHPSMSIPDSGTLTHYLCHSSIRQEIFKTRSTSRVCYLKLTTARRIEQSIQIRRNLYHLRVITTRGGFGSLGYRAPWQPIESQKLLLRTHTTACSARLLRQLATRRGGFKPVKMFSIDRVFRNEAVDVTPC